jgi:hypothetical protein
LKPKFSSADASDNHGAFESRVLRNLPNGLFQRALDVVEFFAKRIELSFRIQALRASTKSRLFGQVAAVTFADEQPKAVCGHARRFEKPLYQESETIFLVGRPPPGKTANRPKLPTRNWRHAKACHAPLLVVGCCDAGSANQRRASIGLRALRFQLLFYSDEDPLE